MIWGRLKTASVRLTVEPQTFQGIETDGFELSLTAETNRNYVIQFSTDLANWYSLSTNFIPPSGVVTQLDTSAKNSPQQRSYRAFAQP